MIRMTGTAAIASARTSVRTSGASAAFRSARTSETPTMIATFANSEGWMLNPAGSRIHAWAPLIVLPSGESTSTSPRTLAANRMGV